MALCGLVSYRPQSDKPSKTDRALLLLHQIDCQFPNHQDNSAGGRPREGGGGMENEREGGMNGYKKKFSQLLFLIDLLSLQKQWL